MLKRFAGAAKVGEKGQIVIPKEVRDMFGIKPGDTLIVLADVDRGIAIMPSGAVMDLADKALPLRQDTADDEQNRRKE